MGTAGTIGFFFINWKLFSCSECYAKLKAASFMNEKDKVPKCAVCHQAIQKTKPVNFGPSPMGFPNQFAFQQTSQGELSDNAPQTQ